MNDGALRLMFYVAAAYGYGLNYTADGLNAGADTFGVETNGAACGLKSEAEGFIGLNSATDTFIPCLLLYQLKKY